MKGIMFTSFLGWVEATRGLVTADSIVTETESNLSTGGAYTSVGDYPASELNALVERLAALEGTTSNDILREFGVAVFPQLSSLHPSWMDGIGDLYGLLSGIENVIHTEVRKLYSDSQPPLITATRLDDGNIEVTYMSHRGLVSLCQGLIKGAAQHFNENCDIRVMSVDHDGDMTRAVMLVKHHSNV